MLIQQLNIKVQTGLKMSASWQEVGFFGDKIKKRYVSSKMQHTFSYYDQFSKHFYCVGKFCNFLK